MPTLYQRLGGYEAIAAVCADLITRLRADAYAKQGVEKIGFWRLGQEDPEIWRVINAE